MRHECLRVFASGPIVETAISLHNTWHWRAWRNWQTRMVEGHVPEREWKFESSRPHLTLS
jgi:hypothetical protein